MAAYNVNSSLGQQLASMLGQIVAAKQTADRMAGDFAALETNGGATDADFDEIKLAMGLADDLTAHQLVSLVGTIKDDLTTIVGLGGFYKWDPAAN